jgi:hypothetical protein
MTGLTLDGLRKSLCKVSQLFSKDAFRLSELLRIYVDFDGSVAAVASPRDIDVSGTVLGDNGEHDISR